MSVFILSGVEMKTIQNSIPLWEMQSEMNIP